MEKFYKSLNKIEAIEIAVLTFLIGFSIMAIIALLTNELLWGLTEKARFFSVIWLTFFVLTIAPAAYSLAIEIRQRNKNQKEAPDKNPETSF